MKYPGLLLAVLLLLSCESNEIGSAESNLGENVLTGQDESIEMKDAMAGICFDVKIIKIEESRCPSDAVCVHLGWATVSFEIQDVVLFELRTGESKDFSMNGKSLRITLKDVTPYPSSVNQHEKKDAVFVIERL